MRSAVGTLTNYAVALADLAERIDGGFERAVEAVMATRGRVIISGMGKSGIIGKKIAATLASTGTPSFFMHPAEAIHGDLGMITSDDLMILISYSGETDEVIRLVPSLQHFGVRRIALVGKPDSTLARNCDIVLDASITREACPNNLAPTTSTMAALAMGDALAVALIERRDFKALDFARFHPGGSLGRRLLTRVRDVMHTRRLPIVGCDDPVRDVIVAMTTSRLGIAIVMRDDIGEPGAVALAGIITDGDLRRALLRREGIGGLRASDIMTDQPLTAQEGEMLGDAETRMIEAKVSNLIVVDAAGDVAGVVQIYDK
ncbi:arabinose 5-phosphate isomerase [Skermanella stibiiresistens SB22]|uniref:Arabinose 5-phosphate isomerase n=1 Tax=Skermanella stibiiresistens SB22 TaxID=1385369 RepID=W9GYA8_9PROT|nr:arabinose 5-phosphate isomerase [Skermanella stibiiresistens SB22]